MIDVQPLVNNQDQKLTNFFLFQKLLNTLEQTAAL
jgi:hypothetical protein